MTFPALRDRLPTAHFFQAALALFWLAFAPWPAYAARVTLVLSSDAAPYQEVYQVVRAVLEDDEFHRGSGLRRLRGVVRYSCR